MYSYARILTYAKPFKKKILLYFITTFLSILFGLTTYGLVIPLLEILFNQEELNQLLLKQQTWPQWKLHMHYFTQLFNYLFIKTIVLYGKTSALYALALLFIGTTLFNGLFRYLADSTMAHIRIHIVHKLRLAVFKHMLAFPLQYFTDKKKGDIMARITTDIQEIEHAIGDMLRVCLKEPLQLLCYMMVLCYISPTLSLFTLLLLPITGWTIATILKQLRQWADQTQRSLSDLTHFVEEVLRGIRIIKIFGAQHYAIDTFKKECKLYAYTNRAVAAKEYILAPISESLSVIAVSIILVYGGHLVLSAYSKLSASTFIAYIIMCSQTLIPIKMIARSIGHIQRGLAAGRRVFQLLDETSQESKSSGNLPYTTFQHAITLREVSFSYNDSKQTLTSINCTIQKGETVAIVGASGSGKSTLLSLLAGLYQPNTGQISIDNVPLAHISNTALHQLIGIVTQESILLHDTIFHNIVFNRPGFSEEDVIAAAKAAYAHTFITNLPQGYHTIIGARGDKLSGGQKQQICIARAILSNPPILILDEATSALDSVSERKVQEGLQTLIQNKTTIMVAHRLSTIYHVDKIIVLDQGRIIEQGTHQSLLQQGGMYKKLFSLQQ